MLEGENLEAFHKFLRSRNLPTSPITDEEFRSYNSLMDVFKKGVKGLTHDDIKEMLEKMIRIKTTELCKASEDKFSTLFGFFSNKRNIQMKAHELKVYNDIMDFLNTHENLTKGFK